MLQRKSGTMVLLVKTYENIFKFQLNIDITFFIVRAGVLLIVIAIGVGICLYYKMIMRRRQEQYVHISF